MRAGTHFPEPRHAALRRVVGAGLAQFGEKTEQVSALLAVGIDGVPRKHAWFTFAIASHAAVDLTQVLTVPADVSQISRLSSPEFARLKAMLDEMGITLHDEETTEERLAELRQKYEPYVIALARYLQMPLPGWFIEPEEATADDWQTSAWDHRKKAALRQR